MGSGVRGPQQLQHVGLAAAVPRPWSTGLIVVGMGLVAPRYVDHLGIGLQPVSPALAGGFFTIEPLGKSLRYLKISFSSFFFS